MENGKWKLETEGSVSGLACFTFLRNATPVSVPVSIFHFPVSIFQFPSSSFHFPVSIFSKGTSYSSKIQIK